MASLPAGGSPNSRCSFAVPRGPGRSGARSRVVRSTVRRLVILAFGSTALGLLIAVAAYSSFDNQGRTVLPIDGFVEKVASYPGGGAILATSLPKAGLYRLLPDGSLDPSFGVDGFVERHAMDFATQPDGKILVLNEGGDSDPVVTRLLSSGASDPSFGANGEVEVDFGGYRDVATSIAVGPGEKIVVSGSAKARPNGRRYPNRPAMARLRADGSPDRSFGGDGVATPRIPFPPPSFGPVGVAPDGTIVAIIYVGFHANWARMVRIESDGSLDRSFGGGGYVRIGGLFRAKPPLFPPLEEIDVLRDGRIMVGGEVSQFGDRGSTSWGVVTRRLPSGRRDRTYGGDGVVRTQFEGSFFPDGIVVRPDGAAVLGGHVIAQGRGSRLAIAGFEPNGQPDHRIGHGGRASVDFGENAFGHGIAIQPGGAVLAIGKINDGGDRRETIAARFEPRLP
jgi:uncharacterized delta-60 repeat protein